MNNSIIFRKDVGEKISAIKEADIRVGIVFALALAFGLGGKDMAKDYMEKKLLKGEEKDDIEHL